MPSSFCRSRISASIWAWIVTSSAVVGSSAISSAGRQASAMAIIARWRMPPESWCGYSQRPPLGLGDPDQAQHFDGLLPRLLAGHRSMQADRLGDLVADPHHRVERGHRLLEDHRDAVAADRAHLVFVEAEKIGAFEHDGAADDLARRVRHQAHDRKRGHALAAAGLADDGQRLAATDVE